MPCVVSLPQPSPERFLPPCRWLNKSWAPRLWKGRICGRTPPGRGFLCRLGALQCTVAETGIPELCSLACRPTGSEASGFLSPPGQHWQRSWWWRGRRSRHLCKEENKRECGDLETSAKMGIIVYADWWRGSERPERHSLRPDFGPS